MPPGCHLGRFVVFLFIHNFQEESSRPTRDGICICKEDQFQNETTCIQLHVLFVARDYEGTISRVHYNETCLWWSYHARGSLKNIGKEVSGLSLRWQFEVSAPLSWWHSSTLFRSSRIKLSTLNSTTNVIWRKKVRLGFRPFRGMCFLSDSLDTILENWNTETETVQIAFQRFKKPWLPEYM